jgi:4-carboxymuconolactone decarboxylase
MTRITPVTAPYSAALADRFARLLPPGTTPPVLFRAVARNEALFNHMVDSGLLGPTGLMDRRTLPAALREALILRTCVAWKNHYEWQLHVGTIARRMGLSDAQIADTRRAKPDPALWPAQTFVLFELVDALVQRRAVDDALFTKLRQVADEALLIEVTQLAGLYAGVGMLCALIEPEADPYGAALPLDESPQTTPGRSQAP